MNGLKVELMGYTQSIPGFYQADLVPGDYSARSMKKTSQTMAASLRRNTKSVFPDKTVRRCTAAGISSSALDGLRTGQIHLRQIRKRRKIATTYVLTHRGLRGDCS